MMRTCRTTSVAVAVVATLILPGAMAAAAPYYVDAVGGNDGNNGSSGSPWRTVAKAMTTIGAGDTVNLLPGAYGAVNFHTFGWARGTSWAAPITLRNDPGSAAHSATFTSVWFSGGATNYYIRLEGLKLNSNVSTAVYGMSASCIQIVDFVLHGNVGATAGPDLYCIWFRSGTDVLVEDCEIYYTRAVALEYGGMTNSVARGNHVYDITGSALRTGGGSDLVYEYNRIENQRPEWEPGVHGSGLSMHSSNSTVRGNIVRNFGNTRPIRWYQDVAGDYGYSNLLIENNLTYENYAWAPEFIDMGSNCVFRNNTFIGGARIRFARLVDGSGLHVYNNVVTGDLVVDNFGTSSELNAQSRAVATAKWPNVHEGNNIIHGLVASGGGWKLYNSTFQSGDGNIILLNDSGNYKAGYDSTYFSVGSFFASNSGSYPYQLAATSPAVDFADPANAPTLDLLQVGRGGNPDAGAYESGDAVPPVADAGPDQTVTDTDEDGFAVVTLDGTGSSSASGPIIGYLWSEGARLLGTTAVTPAAFTVGEHTVALKVTDAVGDEATDTVVITVTAGGLRPGDCDGDGDVDLDDFVILKSSFGSQSATHAEGDFDGDDDVDLDDFVILKQEFGG